MCFDLLTVAWKCKSWGWYLIRNPPAGDCWLLSACRALCEALLEPSGRWSPLLQGQRQGRNGGLVEAAVSGGEVQEQRATVQSWLGRDRKEINKAIKHWGGGGGDNCGFNLLGFEVLELCARPMFRRVLQPPHCCSFAPSELSKHYPKTAVASFCLHLPLHVCVFLSFSDSHTLSPLLSFRCITIFFMVKYRNKSKLSAFCESNNEYYW